MKTIFKLTATFTLEVQVADPCRPLPSPGPLALIITAENQDVLTFKINLPPEPTEPNDIANGELIVTVAGGTPTVIPTTKGQSEVIGLTGNQGERVEASFAYIDDAGNRSVQPSAIDVVLSDNIPPANPGTLSLEVTAES